MDWSRKSVLITGGAGFLGSHLALRLFKEHAEVVVLDDLSMGTKNSERFRCHHFIKDDVSTSNLFEALKDFDIDYIFHFGSPSSVILFNRNPEGCMSKTIFGFRNMMEYAKRKGVSKVIYPSSGSVYGDAPIPQSEESLPKPTNLYGISKLVCEHLARLYTEKVPSIGLRIFAGYGPGEEAKGEIASVITLFMETMIKNRGPTIYGDGEQSRDFVYVDDIVTAALRGAEVGYTGVVNVGLGKSYTFNEVAGLINKVLGKNVKPIYVDKPAKYLERTLADRGKQDEILGIDPTIIDVGISELAKHLKKTDICAPV
jgi:nucleoside-diphosphate-sugar epimerase